MDMIRGKRNVAILIKCTESERDYIKSLADKQNKSVADFFRMLVQDYDKNKYKHKIHF